MATSPEEEITYKYDVFLSFRGNTRHEFTDLLYDALIHRGIRTFRDDPELRMGNELNTTLLQAIDKSRMSMVVLCDNYAFSTWCLDELAKIVNGHEKQGKKVIAIFYKVEVSDVQDQKNTYEAGINKHQKWYSEKIPAWRSALSKVCTLDLNRELFTKGMYEPDFIRKIVNDTAAMLPPLPSSNEQSHIVGFDSRFEQVKSLLDIDSNDHKVGIIEIYGPGGIGKTKFAKEVFNKMRYHFKASCFLAKVRETSKRSIEGLESLQKRLLSNMGEDIQTTIGSTFRGGSEIKRRFGHRRVLLVLDDIDSVHQLESLAGGGDWFGQGSRIIITTRDTAVLDKHVMGGGAQIMIKKYEMKELNDADSLQLFCWHAFNTSEPAHNFANISSLAVSFAKGFPLAIELIGSNLSVFSSVQEWEVEVQKYRNVQHQDGILQVLKISYDSLFEMDQKSFLDIACFFKGETWEYVQRILQACDFFPIIRAFVSKCLITIDENGCLEMHDLIQDMGREIVRKQSPSKPGDRSRLWSHEEVIQVLQQDSGSSTIEGILLHPPRHEQVDSWIDTAFKKMNNLRILIVRNTEFSTGPSHLPNSLRLLDWKGYPSKSFPQGFYPDRIVDFKLPHSSLILKEPLQVFTDLTFINISQCQSITQIPDVSNAKNLRVLTLERCHKLKRFDESVGFLPNLVNLSASECSMLESFVPRMYLPSLQVLSFNFCKRLGHFPRVMEEMDKPLRIHMTNTAITEFPKSIGNLIGLEYIDMSFCKGLKDLSSSFLLLPKLVTLIIDGCSQLGKSFQRFEKRPSGANTCPNLGNLYFSEANLSDEDLLMVFNNFPKLEYLNVSHNNSILSIPEYMERSLQLKSLDLSHCRKLLKIPQLPLSIQKIDARFCQSLTSQASTVLWSQISQEKERVEVVMPKTKIPEWFDYVGNEGIPLFWARQKFPVVALALVFGGVKNETEMVGTETGIGMISSSSSSSHSHIVGLHIFIDGKELVCKDYHYFSVGEDHVLLCDVRVLLNEQEWQSGVVGDEWKAIQVQYESPLILTQWGVYVYKKQQETNIMDDIQFNIIPSPTTRSVPPPTSNLVPKRTPQLSKQRLRHMIENYHPREVFGEYTPLVELDENPFFSKALMKSWRNAKADVRGESSSSASVSASSYGASLKQEHEESPWDVVRVLELIKDHVPKHIADSYSFDDIQSAQTIVEQILRARAEFMKENGQERLDIDMPIVLEAYHSGQASPRRRYWGRLKIKHDDPAFRALLHTTNQLSWRRMDNINQVLSQSQSQERVNVILLKSQQQCLPVSIGEASSSRNNDELLEKEYVDPVLQELMSRIEQDAMRFNKSYGNLKASVLLTDTLCSDEYLRETLYLRGEDNLRQHRVLSPWGKLELQWSKLQGSADLRNLGSSLKDTPYGNMRVKNSLIKVIFLTLLSWARIILDFFFIIPILLFAVIFSSVLNVSLWITVQVFYLALSLIVYGINFFVCLLFLVLGFLQYMWNLFR